MYVWTDSMEKVVKVSSGEQPPQQPPQPPQPPQQIDEIMLATAAAIAFAIGLSLAEVGRK